MPLSALGNHLNHIPEVTDCPLEQPSISISGGLIFPANGNPHFTIKGIRNTEKNEVFLRKNEFFLRKITLEQGRIMRRGIFSRDGAAAAFLGKLCQDLTSKDFFFLP